MSSEQEYVAADLPGEICGLGTPAMPVVVTDAQDDAFHEVARLHQAGIREGFLSTLGAPFLTALYRGIAAVQGSGVLVAATDGKILGFLAYTSNVKACYKQVLRSRWPALVWAMIPNLFRLPIYRRVVETLLYPFTSSKSGRATTQEANDGEDARPELLAIAVDEAAHGRGVGKRLVAAMDEAIREQGIDGYFVVTHGVDARSNAFYAACGFEKTRELEHHGNPMNEYFRRLG